MESRKQLELFEDKKTNGMVKKFTIKNIDCYLAIVVNKKNEITYLDLNVSKVGEELRVYKVLFDVITEAINNGTKLERIIDILINNNFEPSGFVSSNGESHYYKSIVDFVARFLKERFLTK